ncbi:hypothetical protein EVAR_8306_1 [Eumeta japonica]|uniref:Uncharacterized protein n=1 Tax=Eumeta variegata TaxID=151549 RepID=A0A4C1VEU6_EUMVA|nr:hypothetical protein EVAR_8306_1 [Eumeta japonica]
MELQNFHAATLGCVSLWSTSVYLPAPSSDPGNQSRLKCIPRQFQQPRTPLILAVLGFLEIILRRTLTMNDFKGLVVQPEGLKGKRECGLLERRWSPPLMAIRNPRALPAF